jgi:hypothetical protein
VKNKMTDLRNHLFETLEALKDEEKPMDLARAKAISEVAQTIINSAKVEIEFMEVVGGVEEVEFFDAQRRLEDGSVDKLRIATGRRSA